MNTWKVEITIQSTNQQPKAGVDAGDESVGFSGYTETAAPGDTIEWYFHTTRAGALADTEFVGLTSNSRGADNDLGFTEGDLDGNCPGTYHLPASASNPAVTATITGVVATAIAVKYRAWFKTGTTFWCYDPEVDIEASSQG